MPAANALSRPGYAVILAVSLVTLLTGAQPAAQAAPLSPPPTFTVTSNADVAAGGPLTNGICQTAPNNSICTLRAAIDKANNWPGGGVTIHVPGLPAGARYALTIGELGVSQSMTIIGAGAANTIIDASQVTVPNRVLDIGGNITVTISGVTIQGGHPPVPCGCGAGIYVSAVSTLTLAASRVISNTAQHAGGGIYNDSEKLTLLDSSVSHNTAGTVGGGLYSDGLALEIVNSTISGNTATGTDGGGISNYDTALDIVNSTISDNFAYRSGAGIFNDFFGKLRLYNVTLAGNAANQNLAGGTGGGLYNNNSSGATAQLQNTLMDANTHMTIAQDVGDDCAGTVIAQDYNLFSSTAGCLGPGSLDVKNQPGLTGPLQDNGGSTFTNALLPGSPAIDAGNPAGCTGILGADLLTDQRGLPRLANGAGVTRCDIGAFERQRALALPLVLK